jgi:2OG-Fe(II) oxygenase superfamily
VRRAQRYWRLEATLKQCTRMGLSHLPSHRPPSFESAIITIPDFHTPEHFEALRGEIVALDNVERSYVPTHKRGGTIAYETIIERAPKITCFYHSEVLQALVSRIVGVKVRPTPLNDQSSLSILVYDRPGDHIGWHYDHNFYRGRHFTLLLPVENTGSGIGGRSHARLWAKIDGTHREIEAAPNTLVLFEGAKVLHKVSPIIAGERRVVISMTYCTDARASGAQAVARRIKDTAFFGIRALWT